MLSSVNYFCEIFQVSIVQWQYLDSCQCHQNIKSDTLQKLFPLTAESGIKILLT